VIQSVPAIKQNEILNKLHKSRPKVILKTLNKYNKEKKGASCIAIAFAK
jgi:hypothetical protein